MVSPLTDKIYDLDMARAFSIDRAHDRTVRCIETHLWITEEGWSNDIIVAPGETHSIKSKGRVAISTLGRWSRFSITSRLGRFARLARQASEVWLPRLARRAPRCPCQINPHQ